jgi:hypothetical protein
MFFFQKYPPALPSSKAITTTAALYFFIRLLPYELFLSEPLSLWNIQWVNLDGL